MLHPRARWAIIAVAFFLEMNDMSHHAISFESCAYRKSNPGILVVQSAQNRATENASNCLGGA